MPEKTCWLPGGLLQSHEMVMKFADIRCHVVALPTTSKV